MDLISQFQDLRRSYILIVLLLSFPCLAYTQQDSKKYIALAEQEYKGGKLHSAYKHYLKAAEIDQNYQYYNLSAKSFWLGYNISKSKNRKRVEELYNKSFKLKPWNPDGLLSRAEYWEYLSNYSMALRDLDSLLVRDSFNIEGYLAIAKIYMNKKDTIMSNRYYNLAIRKSQPKDLENIFLQKATYAYSKGFWNIAMDSYRKLLELDEKNFKFYCMLSSACYNSKKIEEACNYYKKCESSKWLMLKPKNDLENNCR